LKQGKFEDAIEYLKKFNAGDLLIQARAYSLIGDAYLELKDNEDKSDGFDDIPFDGLSSGNDFPF